MKKKEHYEEQYCGLSRYIMKGAYRWCPVEEGKITKE